MGHSPWIMWKKERIVVVEYINKFVCKGRNRKRRIKRVRTSRLIEVVRPYSIEEVGEYPEQIQGINNDQEKQCRKSYSKTIWID
jgi:hypothetical protein